MACFWSGKSDGGADLYLLQANNLWLLIDEGNGDLVPYTIQTYNVTWVSLSCLEPW